MRIQDGKEQFQGQKLKFTLMLTHLTGVKRPFQGRTYFLVMLVAHANWYCDSAWTLLLLLSSGRDAKHSLFQPHLGTERKRDGKWCLQEERFWQGIEALWQGQGTGPYQYDLHNQSSRWDPEPVTRADGHSWGRKQGLTISHPFAWQLCTLRKATITSVGSCVRRPLKWAERTERTTDRLPSMLLNSSPMLRASRRLWGWDPCWEGRASRLWCQLCLCFLWGLTLFCMAALSMLFFPSCLH